LDLGASSGGGGVSDRDELADVLMDEDLLNQPQWGRAFALLEADAVLEWMDQKGYRDNVG
jgi:hypothetical protein